MVIALTLKAGDVQDSAALPALQVSGVGITDANGNAVSLACVSWFGLETDLYAPHGLWVRSAGSMLDQISALGYNCIRLPFSNQLFDSASIPSGIDFNLNPELIDKTGIEILDLLIDGAATRGLYIILDRHRPDAYSQSALWYTNDYSEARWISDWTMLASRYLTQSNVVGCDLHNEPRDPATWGSDDATTDWRLAAERAGNAILNVNPSLLIIVEGIQTTNGGSYWAGGNLQNAGAFPVRLNSANLVYSTHDYPASVYNQAWFSDPQYPNNLTSIWDNNWGYLFKNGIAPVFVGEFGTRDETVSDQQWFQTITSYLQQNNLGFAYWCWNPNSSDTGGILQDDWTTVNTAKQLVIQQLMGH